MRQSTVYATNEVLRRESRMVGEASPMDSGYAEVLSEPSYYQIAPVPPQRISHSLPREAVMAKMEEGYETPRAEMGRASKSSTSKSLGNRSLPEYAVPEKRLEDTVSYSLDKESADSLIRRAGAGDGMYCFRRSRSHPGAFVLCVAAGGDIKHYPVALCDIPYEGQYAVLCPGPRRRFRDLGEVEEYYSRQADGIAVRLSERVG